LNVIQAGKNIDSETTRKYYPKDLVQKKLPLGGFISPLLEDAEFFEKMFDIVVSKIIN
jgi:hypothetical protein